MFDKLKHTYSGKKVLVTGHTGFKGSWLLKILNLLNADVMGYALAPYGQPNLYQVINGDALCQSVIADLRNREALQKAVEDFQPDFVFHLAAQPLVRLSYQIPAETFEVNAIGTANLLDAVARLNKRCDCVLITTDKVYHNYEWERSYHEDDRLGGYDPYSASKACAELVIDSYRNSFFNINTYHQHQKAIAVARAGNIIGGGDWSTDRLIPDVIKALSENQRIEIRSPNAVRPWQHVLEPLCGYLLLGAKLYEEPQRFAQAYNFGPQRVDALTVKQMVELAIDAWGSGDYWVNQQTNQPHEAGLLTLDINKALSQLNWQPKHSAAEAVDITCKWYKTYLYNREQIIAFTEQQITSFLAIA